MARRGRAGPALGMAAISRLHRDAPHRLANERSAMISPRRSTMAKIETPIGRASNRHLAEFG
jgi:hypothetical protein